MAQEALGMIETRGLTAAIPHSDVEKILPKFKG